MNRQQTIALMLDLASDCTSEMYYRDRGTLIRRSGAAHREAFWNGYDGTPKTYVAGSWCAWAYAAGKKFRRHAPEWVPDARTSR